MGSRGNTWVRFCHPLDPIRRMVSLWRLPSISLLHPYKKKSFNHPVTRVLTAGT